MALRICVFEGDDGVLYLCAAHASLAFNVQLSMDIALPYTRQANDLRTLPFCLGVNDQPQSPQSLFISRNCMIRLLSNLQSQDPLNACIEFLHSRVIPQHCDPLSSSPPKGVPITRGYRGSSHLAKRQRRVREAQAWKYLHELASGGSEYASSGDEDDEDGKQSKAGQELISSGTSRTVDTKEVTEFLQVIKDQLRLDEDLLALLSDMYRAHREYFCEIQRFVSQEPHNRTSKRQRAILHRIATQSTVHPTPEQIVIISEHVWMSAVEVRRWFQNHRAAIKRGLKEYKD